MEFIGVFFFPLIGFFMLFFPEDIFEIVNSRKNEANGEPTRSFLIGTRIGGAIMMLIGIPPTVNSISSLPAVTVTAEKSKAIYYIPPIVISVFCR